MRQPDGKLLVAASNPHFHGNTEMLLARFTRSGRLDPTFGHRGRERLGVRRNFGPQAVHVLPDGRILALGAAGNRLVDLYPEPNRLALFRLLPDGSRDRTFGTNGFVTWHPPWRADTLSMNTLPVLFVQQDDGRVLTASVVVETRGPQGLTYVERIAFVRFNQDGSVDRSFGRDGVVEQFEGRDTFYAWAALRDGHIVALASHGDEPDPAALWLHRFTLGGALDPAFGMNGSLRLELSGLVEVHQLLPARDGSFVLIGSVDQSGRALPFHRILPDGQLDSSFATACGRPPLYYVRGAAVTRHGGLLATTGHLDESPGVVRYGSNGCAVGRPLRLSAMSGAGPPSLQGRRRALVAATYGDTEASLSSTGLALIRIRR